MYLTVVFLCLSLSVGAGASSLLEHVPLDVYGETKTRQVGDLITLVIVESSQAVQRAETSMGQSSEVSVKPGGGGSCPACSPSRSWGAGRSGPKPPGARLAGGGAPTASESPPGLLRCCPVEICALKDGSSSLSTMKSRS